MQDRSRRTKQPRVAVIGAGWAGAAAARRLYDMGISVEVFERSDTIGGHSRSELLNGVVYEPNGAHIFHTSIAQVARFVMSHGLTRPYGHSVLTSVRIPNADQPRLFSWPLQVDELRTLPFWPKIASELESRPVQPSGSDFETWTISLMGPTLYRLFIEGYTQKQWAIPPSQLSSSFAPNRIDLRTDGNRRLFRDRWEFFQPRGVNEVVESILRPVPVTYSTPITLDVLDSMSSTLSAAIITAPLDEFVGKPSSLAWRGITMRSTYLPMEAEDGTATASYVINYPDFAVPFTRTVETKHATGQLAPGTVVSEEYPGSPYRHYPIPTVERKYERVNDHLKNEIRNSLTIPVVFCGRLANYQYINQDEAILQGFLAADALKPLLYSRRLGSGSGMPL